MGWFNDKEKRSEDPAGDEEIEVTEAELVDGADVGADDPKTAEEQELKEARLLQKTLAENESLREQLAKTHQRWTQLQAEFSNYKRRTAAEKEDIQTRAAEQLVEELLPILDNFERALESIPEDTGYFEGVEMIFNQLQAVLKNQGLEAIDCMGKPFDYRFHEAVSGESGPNGRGLVGQQFSRGYLLRGKVLRPSKVHVIPECIKEEDTDE